MLYAVDADGVRRMAEPGVTAFCPQCNGEVRAKCGKIKVWHWSHVAKDCDPWSEPESDWHLGWKSLFPKECCEVSMGPHRADVRINGTVIEFQKSPISPDEIAERESFYGDMVWVLDGNDFFDRLTFCDGAECVARKGGWDRSGRSLNASHDRSVTWIGFDWKHARKSWSFASKPVFFHFARADRATTNALSEYVFRMDAYPSSLGHGRMVPLLPDRRSWGSRHGRGRVFPKQFFLNRQSGSKQHLSCPLCYATEMIRSHVGLLRNQFLRFAYRDAELQRILSSICFTHLRSALFYFEREFGIHCRGGVGSWILAVESVIKLSSFDLAFKDGIGFAKSVGMDCRSQEENIALQITRTSVEIVGEIARLVINCVSDDASALTGFSCDRHSDALCYSITDDGFRWKGKESSCQ